ncbi:Zinc-responsive transcriptional regulator ZAP1 OS=Saccharomyces cerevisiae (strain ATCC 204508 / S288c) GN=ZAP1 PE=1 SV=1 [Rhizoctonia solani AG-1 IB]|uniref:Zinc-responsive transcriptional regulator ZAP1 n=1 Tax=Thanatephorus cucumeris (strain AG1-IB / isolate 7/3/14) TaxID=1108050 RepID=A0A0B7FY91_THACB|nr:Zinc-responsive transcriptional regulator ZAP1 OS=Saccharomyces cerevisiae (strain ATCC 204508 / S288c) GN=ZAP1 PE=1 SV=1 [Rhizoctonia solani AG-1 IB]
MSRRYNPYPARNWAQCKDTHCQPRPNLTENCPPDCVQYAIPCTNTCTFEDDCDSSTCPDTENFGNSLWHTTHYTQHFPLMNADAPLGDDLQQQLDLQFDCCANDYYPENECCVPLPITDASGSTSNINLNQYAAHQIGLPALFKAHHDSLPLPPPSASGPSFSTAPTPELSPADYFPHPVPSSSAASFACLWSNCGQCFPSLGELVGHVNLAHLRLPADAPTHDHAHGAPACHTAPLFPDTSQTSQQDVLTCLWSDCSLIPAPLDTSGADNASLCALASHLFHDHLHLPTEATSDIFNLNPPLSPSSASVQTPAAQALSPPSRDSSVPSTSTSAPLHSHKGKEKASPAPEGQTHTCRWTGCSESFSTSAALTEHLSSVHVGRGKAAYDCFWSGCTRHGEKNGFSSKQKVLRHLQSHTGHRPFRCEVCGVDFSEAATLQQHMRRHTQEKPYVCDFPGCGKAFAITGALTIHKRTHNGDKPFKCKYCDRAFSESSNLSKHLRTHTGQRPYACPEPGCGKKFSRPDQVTRHRHVHQKKSKEDAKDKDDDDMGADVGIDVGED